MSNKHTKKFRLEGGTRATASVKIYRAYTSKRNREKYLERKQNEYAAFSLDDTSVSCKVSAEDNVEEIVEKRLRLKLLHTAIAKLSKEEQQLLDERFFKGKSLRELEREYGDSHTYIGKQIHLILEKLKQDIMNNSD